MKQPTKSMLKMAQAEDVAIERLAHIFKCVTDALKAGVSTREIEDAIEKLCITSICRK